MEAERLTGRVALVTGASRGIGRAIAVELGRRGAEVVLNYRANEEAAREALAAVEASGGKGCLRPFDVGDPDQVNEAIRAVVQGHGRLDILINNAGIAVDGLLMRYSDEDWHRVLTTNLSSAFYCARAASRPMMKGRWGRIVNVASVVGQTGNAGQAAYAAAKAGLEGLTRSLARELASRAITVNAVAPGFIETDMTRASIPESAMAALLDRIPAGRIGQAQDVAPMVGLLCTEAARYITGQTIGINGGLYM